LKYAPRRQYDAVVKDLKPTYIAIDSDPREALEAFDLAAVRQSSRGADATASGL